MSRNAQHIHSARPLRLVTLGTSLTSNGGWQAALAEGLESSLACRVVVAQVARGGATSRWGCLQVQAVAAHRPDIVLIEFLINDANWRRRLSIARSFDNHRVLIAALRKCLPNCQPMLMTMNPAWGLRSWLLRPRFEAYEGSYRRLAAEQHLPLLEITPLWRQQREDFIDLIPDGIHPTAPAVIAVAVPAMVRAVAAEAMKLRNLSGEARLLSPMTPKA